MNSSVFWFTSLLLSSVFILCKSSSGGMESPIDPPLHEVCKILDKFHIEGSIESRKKVIDECAKKIFSPENISSVMECKEIFDYDNKEFFIKACASPSDYEAKFKELKSCLAKYKPKDTEKKSFYECVVNGFSAIKK
ncbi:uncharacterized protein LOC141851698 [Brevipalpus obovatus]|uniref:uncharacterized protein LOC141851698 n=1 Tax=Brevipalpus obovatus TaxID=246614 RepID=UPI003D9F4E9F